METRQLLQERQASHLPDHDYSQPLRVAVPGLQDTVHGEVSAGIGGGRREGGIGREREGVEEGGEEKKYMFFQTLAMK